jgi:peptide/nickel transport system substrate-binding protein
MLAARSAWPPRMIDRRDFLGWTAVLGMGAAAANLPFSRPANAAPVRGGILKAGLQGGEATNSLDPALNLSQVMFHFCKQWGEFLVRIAPDGSLQNLIAQEIGASDDLKTWTIRVRDGIEFHNGKTVGAEDVAATLERHADEKSKSGALGVLRNIRTIKAQGKEVLVTLAEADSDFPYLMADYHLVIQPNGGKDDRMPVSAPAPTRRPSISRVFAMAASASPITGSTTRQATRIRSRSSSSTMQQRALQRCRVAKCI